MKLPKYFLNHFILTTKYETPISNTKFIISMKLRKLFVSINIERTWLNKEKLDKNTSIYQNLIAFSWASLTFKKKWKTLKLPSIFTFISMVHTTQNNSKKAYKETYKLWVLKQNKKIANFINNQVEGFIYLFIYYFILVLKQNTFMTYPKT